MTGRDGDLPATVDRARQLDKRAIAHLIGLFEDTRPAVAARRRQVIELLEPEPAGNGNGNGAAGMALVVGITGSPGSGKSSLIARLVPELLAADPELTVGVLAVDPSSHMSGGALLGDRTRMRSRPDEKRAYFRSQASAAELGGLAPASFQVCRLLSRLFDLVLVETVGIGQSELGIRFLADHVFLVVQPLGGDEIQYLKAGIVEIPDSFVVNKSDEPSAARSYHQLRASLALARPFDADLPPIHRASARTGDGIGELVAAVQGLIRRGPANSPAHRDVHFLDQWVGDEWGRTGRRCVAADVGDLAAFYDACGDYDRAQERLDELISASVCRRPRTLPGSGQVG